MKNLQLILTVVCILFAGYSYSQNNSVENKNFNINENSKYLGKYDYKKITLHDSSIIYDCFEIYEKNGKLLCSRDCKNFYGMVAGVNLNKKQYVNHFDCEVVKVDESAQKITIKFLDREYTYKFTKNKNGKFVITIIENALVYEKR
jgi:hypothetical protein